jgi:hypothetical protein
MSHSRPDDRATPGPDELAAYADGKLDADTRAAVEAWLADHPEMVDELAGHRRLADLWRQSSPAEPTEDVWAAELGRLHAALPARPTRRWGSVAGAAAVAAAVLLAVSLLRRSGSPDAEPFPVVAGHELQILGLNADDADGLVVGTPPVQGPLVLAEVGDVRVVDIAADTDGMVAEMEPVEPPDSPMISAPMTPTVRAP